MTGTFIQRALNFDFQLGNSSYAPEGAPTSLNSSGDNSASLPDGLRASITISNAGGMGPQSLNARIWGMRQDLMNKFSSLGKPIFKLRADNIIKVSAGNVGETPSQIFQGVIYTAWASPESPDVPFVVEAYAGVAANMKPVSPTSIKGSTDVATIMSGLANKAGFQFQNYGVSGIQMSNQYLAGTYGEQIRLLAQYANINYNIENNVLSIWPMNKDKGTQAVVVDKDHGMIGYPVWTSNGLIVTTLYNPSIVLGGSVQVNSSVIGPANGKWSVVKVDHELESQLPNGKWQTIVECTNYGETAVSNS